VARSSLHRSTAFLLACAGLLVCVGTAAGAPRDSQPPGLEPLWSEYPLNPDTAEPPLETSQRPERASERVFEEVDSKVTPASQEDGGSSSGRSTVVAGALAGLTAIVVLIMVLANRPVLLGGFAPSAPARRRRQGGPYMAGAFRWIRGRGDPHRVVPLASPPAEADAHRPRPTAHTRPPNAQSVERSIPVERETQRPPDRVDSAKRGFAGEREVSTAAQVGEHVTAVLASAQQAAEQMRKEAAAETERLRAEAREEIKALMADATREAEKMRGDAGVYSREARQDADAYAGEKRSEAESYASRVRVEAEENAREVHEAAVQDAKRIEKEARRRREVLTSEAERFEERLHSLHMVFGGITTQLETLLSKEPQPDRDDESPREELANALTPNASKREVDVT
jgi:hypothetical protein